MRKTQNQHFFSLAVNAESTIFKSGEHGIGAGTDKAKLGIFLNLENRKQGKIKTEG